MKMMSYFEHSSSKYFHSFLRDPYGYPICAGCFFSFSLSLSFTKRLLRFVADSSLFEQE